MGWRQSGQVGSRQELEAGCRRLSSSDFASALLRLPVPLPHDVLRPWVVSSREKGEPTKVHWQVVVARPLLPSQHSRLRYTSIAALCTCRFSLGAVPRTLFGTPPPPVTACRRRRRLHFPAFCTIMRTTCTPTWPQMHASTTRRCHLVPAGPASRARRLATTDRPPLAAPPRPHHPQSSACAPARIPRAHQHHAQHQQHMHAQHQRRTGSIYLGAPTGRARGRRS